MIIRVTATAVFEYDTEEGLIESVEDAVSDVEELFRDELGDNADAFSIEGEEVQDEEVQ